MTMSRIMMKSEVSVMMPMSMELNPAVRAVTDWNRLCRSAVAKPSCLCSTRKKTAHPTRMSHRLVRMTSELCQLSDPRSDRLLRTMPSEPGNSTST